jgi:hypothetical protein
LDTDAMFWSKIECDGCHERVRKSRVAYYRGSYFCSDACRATWEAQNPPLVAKGEPDKLKRDLVVLVAGALREWQTLGGRVNRDVFTVATRIGGFVLGEAVPLLGAIDARQQMEIREGAKMRFIQHACETIPLLNALGYADEATVLQSHDFSQITSMQPLAAALERAFARAQT